MTYPKQTPYYIIHEDKLKENVEALQYVKQETGCKILLATKAYSCFATYPLIASYLDGTTNSSLNETRLSKETFGKETHVYSPAYSAHEFPKMPNVWARRTPRAAGIGGKSQNNGQKTVFNTFAKLLYSFATVCGATQRSAMYSEFSKIRSRLQYQPLALFCKLLRILQHSANCRNRFQYCRHVQHVASRYKTSKNEKLIQNIQLFAMR